MKRIIFLLITVFVWVSCSNNREPILDTDVPLMVYKVKAQSNNKISLSNIASQIEYIPLETGENMLIHSIDKLEVQDSLFYILDKQNNTIWCFNRKGKYKNKISHKGQGPGEYTQITDFDIDVNNHNFLIWDRNIRKIIFYDMNGNFIKDVKLNNAARQFKVSGDNYLIYTAGVDVFMKNGKKDDGYNFFMLNKEGVVQKKISPANNLIDNISGRNIFSRCNDKIWLHYAVNDTIYEFSSSENKITKKILFDFEKQRLPLHLVTSDADFTSLLNRSEYASIIEVRGTDHLLYVTYGYEMRIRFILHNLDTQKQINGSLLVNDIDYIPFLNPMPVQLINNQLYFVKESSDLLKTEKDGKKTYQTIPSLTSLREDDNPVIAVINLKNKWN